MKGIKKHHYVKWRDTSVMLDEFKSLLSKCMLKVDKSTEVDDEMNEKKSGLENSKVLKWIN